MKPSQLNILFLFSLLIIIIAFSYSSSKETIYSIYFNDGRITRCDDVNYEPNFVECVILIGNGDNYTVAYPRETIKRVTSKTESITQEEP